jgi:predicted PurR-regulated permease PerM
MSVDRFNVPAILIAVVVVCAALNVASVVFAPMALALLIVAMLWPVQHMLQSVMPRSLALMLSVVLLVVVFALFGSVTLWAFGRTARWIINDVSRFQAAYDQLTVWLEGHGIAVAAIWTEHFNTGSAISLIQTISGRLNTTMSFWVVVLVYVFLGLPEVGNIARKMRSMGNPELGRVLLQGSMVTGVKFLMASAVGLPLSKEWGVLAFVLNYIPFLGPLIATLLPTLVAIVEFQYWQSAALVFVALNCIQFAVGSYLEPRVSGNALSISPFLVLFAIFFWTYMWGIFGAFIGVPITIAVLTFCEQHDRTRWLAYLLGGTDQKPKTGGA